MSQTSIDDVTLIIPCIGEDCAKTPRLTDHAPCSWYVAKHKPYGEAIKEGLRWASTPYVATMDADGQHQLRDLPRLYKAITDTRAAMVIGTRTTHEPGPRALGSAFLNFAASVLAGKHVQDFGSGMRIMKREVALTYIDRLPDGFDFNAALTMSFLVNHHKVRWIPITVHKRQWGKSHVRLTDGIKTLGTLCRTRRRSTS